MISVISPAKTLCYDNNVNQAFSYPEFLNKSKKLIEILSKMKVNELSALMKTSEKISELNYQRFKNWNAKFDLNNSKQSIFVFKGDVYIGLDTNTLSEEDLKFSQQNLRILFWI